LDELFKQLVVPLLGGFLFIWVNHRARFLLLPAGGEKFFLACGVLGAIGLFAGTLVSHAVGMLLATCFESKLLHRHWREWIPFTGAQMLALFGLPLFGAWLNRRCPEHEAYSRAVGMSGDTLEIFFEEAMLKSRLILLSLRSGRVYVGKIEETIKPLSGRRHIKIIPFMSGFRWPFDIESDGAKQPNRIHWSTLYKDIVQGIISIGQQAKSRNGQSQSQDTFMIEIPGPAGTRIKVDAREMGVVICVDDIESATRFNQRIYTHLNKDRGPSILEPAKTSASTPKSSAAVSEREPGG
jgi:hypothetical protein